MLLRHLPLLAPVLFAAGLACADVIELEGGGRLHGEVIRDGDQPRSVMTVQSRWGRVVLDRGRVDSLTPEAPADSEYRRRAPTVSDTVDSQYALAMWCRDNGLADAMRDHLSRVVALDPNHEPSRQLLGYQRVGQRWLTRDDVLAARGMVRSKGEFRTQQEVELLERAERQQQIELEWKERLEGWRRDLESRDGESSRAALESLTTLTDPAASGPLVRLLADETDPSVQQLLIRTAGQMRTPATSHALAAIALQDADPEARATAVEQLVADGRPGITMPFVATLGSSDNALINRSADALAALGSTAVIEPLIDALVTTHKQRRGNESGGDTYSFNSGTGQHSFGGGGPKTVATDVRNPRVLAALVALTGVNFSYDEPRWRAWYASQQVAQHVDLRRDP